MSEPDVTHIADGAIRSERITEGAVEPAVPPVEVTTDPVMLRRLIVIALRDQLRVSEEAAVRYLGAHEHRLLGAALD
ncbi:MULTISPECIES: hypothetical protein [unclassified Streptomyces]|uniref:hypothetical protein n=1 Tax=unclassified Streptomyces TaxID=2593676 RepID=UPI00226E6965|nr:MULTISPECIES: hypothetical protein [unclassified Streptomyces]MCY0922570.1 hypothetical protein [Streptomyces sp. H27-G5]MCY0961607.1 hypothetical protein [Streptomyces sp. H27-H5]